MSVSALREVLGHKLGNLAQPFSDGDLQNLINKKYTSEAILRKATRERPALPAALMVVLMDAYAQQGETLPGPDCTRHCSTEGLCKRAAAPTAESLLSLLKCFTDGRNIDKP